MNSRGGYRGGNSYPVGSNTFTLPGCWGGVLLQAWTCPTMVCQITPFTWDGRATKGGRAHLTQFPTRGVLPAVILGGRLDAIPARAALAIAALAALAALAARASQSHGARKRRWDFKFSCHLVQLQAQRNSRRGGELPTKPLLKGSKGDAIIGNAQFLSRQTYAIFLKGPFLGGGVFLTPAPKPHKRRPLDKSFP